MRDEGRRRGRPPGLTGNELLSVAREVFLERGYAGATMDEVAARAGVSKASLYREHASKEELFASVVSAWASAGRDAMRPYLTRLKTGRNARADLIALAAAMRAGILSNPVLRMRRLVTSEAERFPDVASAYLEESWDQNLDELAKVLQSLHRQRRLLVRDPRLAADQFTWLVIGEPLNRALLTASHGDDTDTGSDVADAVDLFLSGYGTADQDRLSAAPTGTRR